MHGEASDEALAGTYVVAVLIGGLLDGMELIGPFATADEAQEWADRNCGRDVAWDVADLDPPDESVRSTSYFRARS